MMSGGDCIEREAGVESDDDSMSDDEELITDHAPPMRDSDDSQLFG